MTNPLLIISILIWPFGQLLQLTPFGSSIRLQLLDLVALFVFLSVFVPTTRQEALKDPLFKPLALFTLTAALSLIFALPRLSQNEIISSFLYLFRFVCYTSFYFAFRKEGIRKYLRYLLLSSAIFLSIGFLQYLFLPDVRFLKYLGFDDHYFRLIGTFLDPNFTGLVLVVMTILAPKLFFLLPLLALVLTFSRASFLALAISLLYLGFTQKKFKLLFLLLVLGVTLYFVPKPFGEGVNLWRTFSIVSRLDNQKKAFDLFLKNPILGVGFNSLKSISKTDIPNLSSGVDNSFIFVLATTGLLGFATFLSFLKKAWQTAANPLSRACLLAIVVHSFFNNSFFYSPILVLFFLIVNLPPRKSV